MLIFLAQVDFGETDPECRDLIERVRVGDRVAIGTLIQFVRPVIQARAARTVLRNLTCARGRDVRQEVEDLTQEVFFSLCDDDWRVLRSWDPTRGLSFRNFIGLVADRQVSSILRSGRRSAWRENPTSGEWITDHLDHALPQAQLEEAVSSREILCILIEELRGALSPLGFRIFELMWMDEHSIEDVAKALELTPNAIYSHRSRLLKKVAEILSRLMQDRPASSRSCPMG